MPPRYPHLQIHLRTSHPLALVSAVRQALRRSGVEASEIERFTEEALTAEEPKRIREVCASWAAIRA